MISTVRAPARRPKESDRWEAHHPSTGRRCGHTHLQSREAVTCASEIGVELDGASEGWYVRRITEWRSLGTVRMTTLDELATSAEQCGLRVVVNEPDDYDRNGSLVILAVEWHDERYVRWREENHHAKPATTTGWWQTPIRQGDWAVDHLGRITGSRYGGQRGGRPMRSSPDRASCQHIESGWCMAENPDGRDLRMPRSGLRCGSSASCKEAAVPVVLEDGSRQATQWLIVPNSSMPWMPARPKSG
jgi:hypothetical protein